jgi:hypothetical protein
MFFSFWLFYSKLWKKGLSFGVSDSQISINFYKTRQILYQVFWSLAKSSIVERWLSVFSLSYFVFAQILANLAYGW